MAGGEDDSERTEVRTYFVRNRNALVARAEFSGLYVDYYLHQGGIPVQHAPAHDQLFKELLAAMTLHASSRPWTETSAWTVHLDALKLNLFVTGNNTTASVIGQIFTEHVRDTGRNLLLVDLVRGTEPPRRSSVDFEGSDVFRAVEAFYARSEQRPARFFQHGEEDFVLVTAQPDCDMAWFDSLDDAAIRCLDTTETLSLLEQRQYRWFCGCNESRMMAVLGPAMRADPHALFGDEPSLRMRCPRCGRRYAITRESLEAFLADQAVPRSS